MEQVWGTVKLWISDRGGSSQGSSWIVLTLALLIGTLGAGIYKWVDEKGVTHYSEAPPPGQKGQRIEIQPGPANTEKGDSSVQSWQQKDEEFKKRHEARQKKLDADTWAQARAQELDAIRRGARTPVPGQTTASIGLQRDVLLFLVVMSGLPGCAEHKVLNTEVVGRNVGTRTTVERWIVDGCGKTIPYQITLTSGPQGGTSFDIKW